LGELDLQNNTTLAGRDVPAAVGLPDRKHLNVRHLGNDHRRAHLLEALVSETLVEVPH
jgi:sirohydrochlorin ferrochelatase